MQWRGTSGAWSLLAMMPRAWGVTSSAAAPQPVIMGSAVGSAVARRWRVPGLRRPSPTSYRPIEVDAASATSVPASAPAGASAGARRPSALAFAIARTLIAIDFALPDGARERAPTRRRAARAQG